MKKLITIALLTLSTASMACVINVTVKKEGAKTAYVNGVSVSQKIRTALESQCTIKTSVLSKAEIKAMTIATLEKRLAKLTAK